MSTVQPITPQPSAPRQASIGFNGFEPRSTAELIIATEIWLEDIMKAPWASREVMKIAAFLSKLAADRSTSEVYLKDIESRFNIQQGEISMTLNMLVMFRTLDKFSVDRGQLATSLKLSFLQQIRIRETTMLYARMQAADAVSETAKDEAAALRDAASEMRAALTEDAA